MKDHGPWKVLESTEVFRDPWIRVQHDQVRRPDGHPGTYSVVHIKPGVCVLAVDDRQRVYLTREFHYGVGRVTVEAVSGGCDGDESPEKAARRELREELGIDAQRWTDLGRSDPFTANVVSPTQLFLAQRLTFGERDPDGTELIERVELALRDAVCQAMDGTISHAPSALLILKVARLLADE